MSEIEFVKIGDDYVNIATIMFIERMEEEGWEVHFKGTSDVLELNVPPPLVKTEDGLYYFCD
jgi:hypothetical protein